VVYPLPPAVDVIHWQQAYAGIKLISPICVPEFAQKLCRHEAPLHAWQTAPFRSGSFDFAQRMV